MKTFIYTRWEADRRREFHVKLPPICEGAAIETVIVDEKFFSQDERAACALAYFFAYSKELRIEIIGEDYDAGVTRKTEIYENLKNLMCITYFI